MILNLALLFLSLAFLVKSADFAINYATKLAESTRLPKYTIGFLIVAVISVLPEGLIAITSAFKGVPTLGLGTLYGGNVADLTLIFALVIFLAGRAIKIESKIIENRFVHIAALAMPIVLGLDGFYSRFDGLALILVGFVFFLYIFKSSKYTSEVERHKFSWKNLALLIISLGLLIASAHFTVQYAVYFASAIKVSPILIGLLVISLGTTLPELLFALKAVRRHHDDMALGDILGTVIADATILIGLMVLIRPFSFNPLVAYVTGVFMVLAGVLSFYFMKTDKTLSRKEAFLLFLFYLIFVAAELLKDGL